MSKGALTVEIEKSCEDSASGAVSESTRETGAPGFSLPIIGSMSKTTKTRLKLGISLVLFASLFIFGKVDLSESLRAAVTADKGLLLAGLLVFLLAPCIQAHRWQLIAGSVGLQKPFVKFCQYTYVGLFFNLFLPSTVGGDFSRAYYVSKGTNKYLHAGTSVLVDRAMGLAVLLLFATVGILFGPGGNGLPMELKIPVFVATLGVYGVIPFVPSIALRVLGPDNWITRKLNGTARVFWQDRGLIFKGLLLSTVVQVLNVVCHFFVGLALGFDVPLWYYFVFYPSVAVIGFITPSINGIGVREWAYTYFLSLAGVGSAVALTYAIIIFGMITTLSLVGGIVYTAGHFTMPRETDDMRLEAN